MTIEQFVFIYAVFAAVLVVASWSLESKPTVHLSVKQAQKRARVVSLLRVPAKLGVAAFGVWLLVTAFLALG